jgi:hypothetical protein
MISRTIKVGGARSRKTVCWSRMSKKGRYVVCNKSKGQRSMRKKKGKSKTKKKSKKGKKGKTRTLRMTWF